MGQATHKLSYLHVRVDPELKARLQELARAHERTVSAEVRTLARAAIAAEQR
ncbi:MAG: ribbon-helix-helix protein, CopG family [Thermoanaerobaculia bacterium]